VPSSAAEVGVKDGDPVAVTGPAGTLTLPLEVTDMPDRVVWLPLNSTAGGAYRGLGAVPGQAVTIGAAPAEVTQ
jgi:NADH-quinone oxidoreductase subunit G